MITKQINKHEKADLQRGRQTERNNTNRNNTERTKNKAPVRQSLNLQHYQHLSGGWENTAGRFPEPG